MRQGAGKVGLFSHPPLIPLGHVLWPGIPVRGIPFEVRQPYTLKVR